MRFFVLTAKNVFKTHISCELIEVTQELLSDEYFFCHGCRDEFEPFCQ